MFRLDKKKIFVLYKYFLLGDKPAIDEKDPATDEKDIVKSKNRFNWFNEVQKNEDEISSLIEEKLNKGWTLSKLPELERAILTFSIYELSLEENKEFFKAIIDQVINFSKAYLDEEKYKYINKVIDLIFKEKKFSRKKAW